MVQKVLYLLRVIPKLGLSNVAYIAWYRVSMKSGWRKRKFPAGKIFEGEFFTTTSTRKPSDYINKTYILQKAEEIYKGNFTFYHHHHFRITPIPDWSYDPFSKKTLHLDSQKKHWTEINEFDLNTGDIKNLWELSRFDWLTDLGRAYALTGDEKYRQRINELLSSWSIHNPVNTGVQWRCGQETSIRVMKLFQVAMICGTTEKITGLLFDFSLQHLKRIRKNINYAIAQDNNHGTTESAVLYIGATWLLNQDSLRTSENTKLLRRYQKKGRNLLEKRLLKLIGQEGTFSQKSVNYHRMVVDTLSFVMYGMKRFQEPPFNKNITARIDHLGRWLWGMVANDGGEVPVLGANDGALLETLHDLDYRDYRPSVQLFYALLKGEKIWEDPKVNEVLNWRSIDPAKLKPISRFLHENHICDQEFIRMAAGEVKIWLHATQDNFRPGNDVLHLDIWYRGENVFGDSGSYSYNAPESSYFNSVSAHNTLQFGEEEPMPRLSRFLNGEWVRVAGEPEITETEDFFSWKGSYVDYRGNMHRREVFLFRANPKIVIEDAFDSPFGAEVKTLRFHTRNTSHKYSILCVNDMGAEILPDYSTGWHSNYYNQKAEHRVLEYKMTGKKNKFVTTIKFKQ